MKSIGSLLCTFFVLVSVLFASGVSAADYHIGPGQTYTTISAFASAVQPLSAGDHVYIHAGTYKEMLFIRGIGTQTNPIIIEGVPDGSGNLPVIDGTDMVIPPAYDGHLSEYDIGGGDLAQGYGLIFLHWSSTQWGADPEYITIKNIETTGAFPETNTFTNSNGAVQSYPGSSAGIYIKTGKHILVEGCTIHDNGNGIDIQGSDETVFDVTLRSNYIYGNGRTDARFDREHNSYTEAVGMVIEYNYYGPLRSGSGGIAIKDRSVGTVIRHNIVYSGARALDLVDSENILNSGYDAMGDPNWGNDWVYGNVFINDENAVSVVAAQPFHYGYDNNAPYTRAGDLRFFNNTVYSNLSSGTVWTYRMFDVSTSAETLHFYNNVFVNEGTTNVYMGVSGLESVTGTFNWLGGNWITSGYTDIYSDTGTWNETVPIIEGSNAGVLTSPSTGDFSIPIGSPLINAGVSLPSSITTYHPVSLQYEDPRTYISRADTDDIGAFIYGAGGAVPTCSDGIQNQDETGIDCGGVCPVCNSGSLVPPLLHPLN